MKYVRDIRDIQISINGLTILVMGSKSTDATEKSGVVKLCFLTITTNPMERVPE